MQLSQTEPTDTDRKGRNQQVGSVLGCAIREKVVLSYIQKCKPVFVNPQTSLVLYFKA